MFFCERMKQNKAEKRLDVWHWLAIIAAAVAQAHTVKGWMGHSWRRGWENCTLGFSLLSEFVYMWKTLNCFPTEEIVIQSFITFELFQVVLFWSHCYFLIQLIDGFLFSFNCNEPMVFCWFSCPHFSFVSSLCSGLAILVFQSALSFPFTQSFKISACVTNSSSSRSLRSEEWRACTSATLLWKQTCHWIKQ